MQQPHIGRPHAGAPEQEHLNADLHQSAQACLFRFNTQLANCHSSFGWALLPEGFGVSGKPANRRVLQWTKSGACFAFWDALVELRFGPALPDPPDHAALCSGTPLDALVLELTRAYRHFNHRFFGGELPTTVVVTVELSRRGERGWLICRTRHGTTAG